jgi:endonuclease III
MKNSKEYSKKVQKLRSSLKRKYPKVKKAIYDEPAEALVYAIVSENMSEPAAESALKRFSNYFVDLNDLRVSRTEEIVEMLREDTPATRNAASILMRALRAVFEEYHTVSLAPLKKIGKRPAKQVLEKMDAVSHFAVNYCMLTSLQGHAIPLTEKMIEYLRSNELVHPDADEQETEGFLTKQVPTENAYEFYALLRRESESRKGKRKKKAKKVKSNKATKRKKAKTSKKKTKK